MRLWNDQLWFGSDECRLVPGLREGRLPNPIDTRCVGLVLDEVMQAIEAAVPSAPVWMLASGTVRKLNADLATLERAAQGLCAISFEIILDPNAVPIQWD
jgi:hypothetical protein